MGGNEKLAASLILVMFLYLFSWGISCKQFFESKKSLGSQTFGQCFRTTISCWFLHFKKRNFELDNGKHPSQPVEFDEERLNQFLHKNPHQTTKELAEF